MLLVEVITRLPELPSALMPAAARVVLAATCWLIWLATSVALADWPRCSWLVRPRAVLAVPSSTWMVPPAPLVLSVRVRTLPATEAVRPLVWVLIWAAMEFLVAEPFGARVTL